MIGQFLTSIMSKCTTLRYSVERRINKDKIVLHPQLKGSIIDLVNKAYSLGFCYPRCLVAVYVRGVLTKVVEYNPEAKNFTNHNTVSDTAFLLALSLAGIPITVNEKINVHVFGIYNDGYVTHCGEFITSLAAVGLESIYNIPLITFREKLLSINKIVVKYNKERQTRA